MTTTLAYHMVASAMRFYRVPANTHSWKGRTVLGFEAGDGLPAWVPPERDAAEQDDALRALVDLLPADQRHVVERVFFGQGTLRQAAAEAGITPAQASNLQARGLETLRGWLADPETVPVREAATPKAKKLAKEDRCAEQTKWGRCKQPAIEDLCALHAEMREKGTVPDREYHRKVVLGLKQPIQAVLSEAEMNATMTSRYRGDGRRLDAYTGFEPLEFDP